MEKGSRHRAAAACKTLLYVPSSSARVPEICHLARERYPIQLFDQMCCVGFVHGLDATQDLGHNARRNVVVESQKVDQSRLGPRLSQPMPMQAKSEEENARFSTHTLIKSFTKGPHVVICCSCPHFASLPASCISTIFFFNPASRIHDRGTRCPLRQESPRRRRAVEARVREPHATCNLLTVPHRAAAVALPRAGAGLPSPVGAPAPCNRCCCRPPSAGSGPSPTALSPPTCGGEPQERRACRSRVPPVWLCGP